MAKKPRPEKVWRVSRAKYIPAWVHEAAPGEKLFDLREQRVPRGTWLVWPEDAPHLMILSPEQFEAEYD